MMNDPTREELERDLHAVLSALDDIGLCRCGGCKRCRATEEAFEIQSKYFKLWQQNLPEF